MSEYQYYEFQALDRRLTASEMSELRAVSSRGRITPTSVTNEYNYGDFKGDPDDWMDRYFDAFLYLANWGTRELKLRLSSALLDVTAARAYAANYSFGVREHKGSIVLSFTSGDDGDGEWVDGEGELSSILGVRADLARGDRRALYLGWLLGAQAGELEDDDEEPPVPAGLGQLGGAIEAFAAFLRIDRDLIDEAAERSAPLLPTRAPTTEDVRAWLATLAVDDKDALLAQLLTDDAPSVAGLLAQRFEKDRRAREGSAGADRDGGGADTGRRRTVAELLEAADRRTAERERKEAAAAAAARERRRIEAAAERARRLETLVGQEDRLWNEVEQLIGVRQAASYDAAVAILLDLSALAERGDDAAFAERLGELRMVHARKSTLMQRVAKAGL